MYWIYYGRLYTTKFQAGCLAKGWSTTAGCMATMIPAQWRCTARAKVVMVSDLFRKSTKIIF